MGRFAPITARWRNIVILSWPIDGGHLDPFVPDGLVLDRWGGEAYISLVGLFVENLRMLGLPVWPNRFEEVNLRFYVHPTQGGVNLRGVVFLRQLVAHRLIALGGRLLFREPMSAKQMRHEFNPPEPEETSKRQRVFYGWRNHGRDEGLWIKSGGDPYVVEPNSLDEFLTARYWGYNAQSARRIRAYRVSRCTWSVSPAADFGLQCDARALYGPQFTDVMAQPPASILLAHGSKARVHWPTS